MAPSTSRPKVVMKNESLPSIGYDCCELASDSLFALWERGANTPIPAPLSVRRSRYRRIIVGLIKRQNGPGATVLSLGAGNGFTEADLSAGGFDVVATDRSEIALKYCRQKGLKVVQYEFPEPPPPSLNKFDVIYCDGLLGHLWQPEGSYGHCWTRFAELAKPGSLLILSNDLADTDNTAMLGVFGVPEARFFRPPFGWFAEDAGSRGLWAMETVRVLKYMRRGLTRRREILLLRQSLVHKREE
jgi:hypothetical protein